MPCGASPSSWCVCQFHHPRVNCLSLPRLKGNSNTIFFSQSGLRLLSINFYAIASAGRLGFGASASQSVLSFALLAKPCSASVGHSTRCKEVAASIGRGSINLGSVSLFESNSSRTLYTLGDLDSNQDYLVQSQACYRCTISQSNLGLQVVMHSYLYWS